MCTRVLWNTNQIAVLTGRSMDWPESTQPLVVSFPGGRQRDGGLLLSEVVVPDNPLRWTSTYGSLVTTVYGLGTVDGPNERGLGVHALYLQSTDVGTRNVEVPGLHTGLWAQYLLDQAASVDEALALMDGIQLVMIAAHGFDATLHLAIEDEGGDSAIIESTADGPVIHHGREFTLMTNDPTYDEQLQLLASKDFSHPSRDLALPGNVNAVDRFQRAAYYSALLPNPPTNDKRWRAYWPSCATFRCRSARPTVNSGCTTPNTAPCVTSPNGCTSSSSRPARARSGCGWTGSIRPTARSRAPSTRTTPR